MNLCIAHGGDPSDPSGGTDRIATFATGLVDVGHDVTLVTPQPSNGLSADLEGVEHVTVPITPRRTVDQPIRAAMVSHRAFRIARRRDAYVQIEHSSQAGVAALMGKSGFVLDMHDLVFPSPQYRLPLLDPVSKRVLSRIERAGVERSDHVIVVSSPIKEFLVERWGVPRGRISVIPNGFSPVRTDGFLDVPEVSGRVGFIGTLHPKLDLQTFAAVAGAPEVESVVVIGDGSMHQQLERLARRTSGTITLTGRLPHEKAMGLLASSQVVVYPIRESLHTRMLSSRKIFDYAALGKAMVLDDVSDSDIWARFKSEDAAVFADPDDRADFVHNVRVLLRDDDRRAAVGRTARELATDYTWDKRVDELVGLYNRLNALEVHPR
ncbi:hypothetical protein CV102_22680 [Natronococcus pandeyae]|uniref:Glycosyltransferase n=1 Tax=Natronococcus pandeyae TaxID=2055836 RepID=A0A8J8PZU9_9EURY|nr:glycosyltransferase [Natronococcus pandeyae]TYL36432.1 hypothetical protein CV102_22680 [Natronococcus pandeyae]